MTWVSQLARGCGTLMLVLVLQLTAHAQVSAAVSLDDSVVIFDEADAIDGTGRHHILVQGRVVDPQGFALPNASVQLATDDKAVSQTTSDQDGQFVLSVTTPGQFTLTITVVGFQPVTIPIDVLAHGNQDLEITVRALASRNETVTVTADVSQSDVLSPDPGEKVFVHEDLLDANPGRPGAPVSIPGYPIETASSGIKAPQYFAPGVAGDHGEPIAQYIALGSYLVPNNLSANAHGNGYSDPNILIPEVLESVQVDGGAFNVREGNHSVNLAATYGLRSRLDPFFNITGDYRDIDAVAGLSFSPDAWVAVSGSYGNGFLDRLEHRQQYKLNGKRIFHLGQHRLSLFAIGYYGFSNVPGLVPIFALNAGDSSFTGIDSSKPADTIDPRQKDQTHTGLVAFNDVWQLTAGQQLQLSGFFRTYNLSLFSDFGQGLIRQSEFRTVAGSNANYVNKLGEYLSLLIGLDYGREAPRRDDLDRYGLLNPATPNFYGPFSRIDANNVTLQPIAPYVAGQGALCKYFRWYLGFRRDQIDFDNVDLLNSGNSFQKWVGVNSPKATFSFIPKNNRYAPLLSLSFGQSFFTEDPRIGTGTNSGTPVATSHSYQLVASKSIARTELKLSLGHVTSSAELAKIDPDTGLQFNEGPSRLRYLTAEVRQSFGYGSLLATFSKADARDLDSGQPTPEAPRTILDFTGIVEKLPFRLQMRGEFEYVGAKPLGTGCLPDPNAECTGTPVKEFRGALVRSFMDGRVSVGVNFLIAGGFTGQTTENFLPSNIQEVVGVRVPSYASATLTYHFGRATAH